MVSSEAGNRHRNVIQCLTAPLTPSKGCLVAVCTLCMGFPQKACKEGPHLSVCRREKEVSSQLPFISLPIGQDSYHGNSLPCIPECIIAAQELRSHTPREVFVETYNNPIQAGLLMARASGMTLRVTSAGKEPWPAEVLAEDKGNMEWVMEEHIHIHIHTYMDIYIMFFLPSFILLS